MTDPTHTPIDAAGDWLAPTAAAAYLRALAAGCPAGVTSAGRSTAEQTALFLTRDHVDPTGYLVYNGVRYALNPGEAPAAVPGTSKHERGEAIDLPLGGPREWMTAYGHPYGWVANRVPGEPWHFEYDLAADTHLADGAPVRLTANTTTTAEDDDMDIVYRNNEQGTPSFGAAFAVNGGKGFALTTGSDLATFPQIRQLSAASYQNAWNEFMGK